MREADLLVRLTGEHRRTEALFDLMADFPPGDPRRRDLLDDILLVLARHAEAEEGFLYPAVRAYLDDGDRLADAKLAEHAVLKRRLADLAVRTDGDQAFDDLTGQLRTFLAAHTADEENELFPRLAAACPPDRLDEIGRKARAAEADADRDRG
ncbi:hemerythrin domain-containing protein [Streptantibioticus silvisoli]|uniref:Hemerythrin domain-containing protein n=1 Tax=Streptantibioticus silvisoli TaxID=2705255 RepID=A0ABT6VY41_9ACTN|nr:hemerythrin domain-containing protein [Streptantibioticus silvisoli]MDI5963405.1 hemerythrin domain-containing protein [Streptantibioticus silvisoli]